MNQYIKEFEVSRSSDLSDEDKERLSILSKELTKKMEEPTSSGQK